MGRGQDTATERWLLETLELILATGFDPALWQSVAKQLAEGWPGVQGVQLLLHSGPAAGEICIGFVQHGFDPAAMRDYERYYAALNPWVPVMQRQRALRASTSNATLPWWRFADSEFYNDFLKPQGEIECGAGIKLYDGGDRFAFLNMHYGSAVAERYDRVLPEVLERLAPALQAAIACNRKLARGREDPSDPRPRPADVLNAIDRPALIVDARGAVRSANAWATTALERGDYMRLDAAGRLRLCDSAAGEKLARRLRRLGRTGDLPVSELALSTCAGELAALMSLFAIQGGHDAPQHSWLFPPERLALLVVRPLNRRPAVAEDTLRRVFGLTGAEALLAARLASGEALDDAAATLGIARETARVHLKAIFAKTDTHRQAELVALLASLAQPG